MSTESMQQLKAERDRLQAAFRCALEQNKTDEEWARDAGLTYDAFRAVLLEQHEDEISFGRAVEKLRALALAAVAPYRDRAEKAERQLADARANIDLLEGERAELLREARARR